MTKLPLLADETVIWQAQPGWRAVAHSVFHVRFLALYFALLFIADTASDRWAGMSPWQALRAEAPLVSLAAGVGAIVLGLAWLTARTTSYTLTNRRLVLRFGMAFPATLGLPLRAIRSMAVRTHADHSGEIRLALRSDEKVSYLKLWPLVRPWRLRHAEPMMRAVPRAGMAATVLSRTLAAAQENARASVASVARQPAERLGVLDRVG